MAARQCGTCTLCCKVMGILALEKPPGAWCSHCAPGKGCTIYQDRPRECRSFTCGWLIDPALGEEWYPRKSKIVLSWESDRIIAHVDPNTPGAWKEQPYFAGLHRMMLANLPQGRPLYVAINRHHIMLLPDRQEDLGELGADDEVMVQTVAKPAGLEYRVQVRRGPLLEKSQ